MKCMVPSCGSKQTRPPNGISFHRFPPHEADIILWKNALGLPDLKVEKSTRVCSKHFLPVYFIQIDKKRRLTVDAIPMPKEFTVPHPEKIEKLVPRSYLSKKHQHERDTNIEEQEEEEEGEEDEVEEEEEEEEEEEGEYEEERTLSNAYTTNANNDETDTNIEEEDESMDSSIHLSESDEYEMYTDEEEAETVQELISQRLQPEDIRPAQYSIVFKTNVYEKLQIDPDNKVVINNGNTNSNKRKASVLERESSPIIIDDDDDDDDVPLAKRIAKIKKEVKHKVKSEPVTKNPKSSKSAEKEKEFDETLYRPAEATAFGGLTIGNIAKKNILSGPDSKELTFSKIQGKTFPSLVVVARPTLRAHAITTTNRPELDSKVKVVLILTPAKFTEWLIQQGLLRSEQRCIKHKKNDLKLGVYSDATKFPYSGGYVWISDCRPVRFISVFNGSIFEAAPNPPSCILKLIYHWSCQTSIQNVIQWVKVDSYYVKTVYTWLRAICTIAIHNYIKPMGGAGKYIEVGVISLGTTTQDGQQRQVKVEVLGVFDPITKLIRLRAIDPINEKEVSYKKRFVKILEPIKEWVLKESILTVDLTIDKGVLVGMGFKNIVQIPAADKTAKQSNAHVMDYLRRIVPRMFQNTLSLLSREMIQQFLDELVWREQYGTSPLETFNNITKHIAEQTRVDSHESLLARMNKVATNPFNSSWIGSLGESAASTVPVKISIDKTPISIKKEDTMPARRGRKSKMQMQMQLNQPKSLLKPLAVEKEKKEKKKEKATAPQKGEPRRKHLGKPEKEDPNKEKDTEAVLFEETFYGILKGYKSDDEKFPSVESFSVECPDCTKILDSNIKLQNDIFDHLVSDAKSPLQCKSCLERFTNEELLIRHEEIVHPLKSKNTGQTYNCIICESRFNSLPMLSGHIQKFHCVLDLPYRCGVCDYRSSSRRNVIEHFHQNHNNVGVLQCNFCLLMFEIYSNGNPIKENINKFVEHVQQHFVKTLSKKCTKCSLTFLTRGALKAHLLFDHQSLAGVAGVKPLIPNTIYYPVTKLKTTQKSSSAYKSLVDFTHVTQCLSPGKMCIECDAAFDEEFHIMGFLKCQKCRYKTCCIRAMLDHNSSCQTGVNPESNVHIKLDREMHCVCGFSSTDGNSMARHLAVCDHKSAYPSVESAQDNTVKRNMLDMLGLMRRPEEAEDAGVVSQDNTAKESEELEPDEQSVDIAEKQGDGNDSLVEVSHATESVGGPTVEISEDNNGSLIESNLNQSFDAAADANVSYEGTAGETLEQTSSFDDQDVVPIE